jgi:hypothetical protein
MAPEEARQPILRPRKSDVVWRRLDEGAVLLDLRSSEYLSINPSATVLWQRLEAGATREQLIEALAETFELSRERAAADVDAFVADCKRRGLVDDGSAQKRDAAPEGRVLPAQDQPET